MKLLNFDYGLQLFYISGKDCNPDRALIGFSNDKEALFIHILFLVITYCKFEKTWRII